MTDLHDRFRSIDRIAAPDLWWEATQRATVPAAAGLRGRDWHRQRSVVVPVAVAAVVLVAVFVGIRVFTGGGVGDSPQPAPTDTRSPSAASTPAILPSGPGAFGGGIIRPGTYELYGRRSGRLPPGWPDTIILTIPDGWLLGSPNGSGGTLTRGRAEMTFSDIASVYADPCATDEGGRFSALDPPVGSTVDDLVAGLRSLPVIAFSEPVDVTLDGWNGKRLELTHPDGCGVATLWQARPVRDEWWVVHSRPGWHTTVWALDVGGQRFVITAGYALDAPAGVRQELDSMVESLDLEP